MKKNILLVVVFMAISTNIAQAGVSVVVNADIQYYDEIYQHESNRLYVGTAAAPDTGTYWNGCYGQYGNTVSNMLASDGVTVTTIDLAVGGTWGGHPSPPAPNYLLMDYGFTWQEIAPITITGLTPGASYNLYLYGNETYDQGAGLVNRGTPAFTFGGVTKSTTGWGGGDPWVEGQTYVLFAGMVADETGMIEGTFGDGAGYNMINGIQIIGVFPDKLNIVESGGSTDVSETGPTSDSFTVALVSQPTANVTITLTTDGQVVVDNPVSGELYFTPTNWSSPQPVTVSADDDDLIEGPHTGKVNYSASSADDEYNNIPITPTQVNITDNDGGPLVHDLPVVVDEELVGDPNDFDAYTVTLSKQPVENVDVIITTDGQTVIDINLDTPELENTLTFTPGEWNTPKSVYVKAIDDAVSEGPHTSTITNTCSSGDTGFNGKMIEILANVIDNEPYCGDGVSNDYYPADLNQDCYVNLLDFAEMALLWLECTDPNPAVMGCTPFP